MSYFLYWTPTKTNQEDILPERLRQVLNKRFSYLPGTVLDNDNIDYLEGLRDADVPGVQTLITAIHKHNEIELRVGEYQIQNQEGDQR